jgi:hypothetical protein
LSSLIVIDVRDLSKEGYNLYFDPLPAEDILSMPAEDILSIERFAAIVEKVENNASQNVIENHNKYANFLIDICCVLLS